MKATEFSSATFAKILQDYVRDRRLMDLQTAIRKMSLMLSSRQEQVSLNVVILIVHTGVSVLRMLTLKIHRSRSVYVLIC